jgi:hypothetical protein
MTDHSEENRVTEAERGTAKARYALEDLLAASDYATLQPAEEREWIDAPPVGKELF